MADIQIADSKVCSIPMVPLFEYPLLMHFDFNVELICVQSVKFFTQLSKIQQITRPCLAIRKNSPIWKPFMSEPMKMDP